VSLVTVRPPVDGRTNESVASRGEEMTGNTLPDAAGPVGAKLASVLQRFSRLGALFTLAFAAI